MTSPDSEPEIGPARSGTVIISILVLCAVAGIVAFALTRRQDAVETAREARAALSKSGLLEAVKSGSPGTVEGALRRDPRADLGAALFSAVHEGHTQVAEFLLSHGAALDPNDVQVAFLEAVRYGYGDIVALHLRANADPNRASPGGEPLLTIAAGSGYADVVKALLRSGASMDARIKAPAMYARSPPIAQLEGMTALHAASVGGHADVVRILIEGGADVNARSSRGFSALRLCRKGFPPIPRSAGGGGMTPTARFVKTLAEVRARVDRSAVERLLLRARARN